MRILIADRDRRACSAVGMLLLQEPGPVSVREATDLDSLGQQLATFQPDLVVLDWDLPGGPALAMLFAAEAAHRRPKVIVLGRAWASPTEALLADADAFVGKDEPPDRLLAAFRHLRAEIEKEKQKAYELEGQKRWKTLSN